MFEKFDKDKFRKIFIPLFFVISVVAIMAIVAFVVSNVGVATVTTDVGPIIS